MYDKEHNFYIKTKAPISTSNAGQEHGFAEKTGTKF